MPNAAPRHAVACLLWIALALTGCERRIGDEDAGSMRDSGPAQVDSGPPAADAGPPDAGNDAGNDDAGPTDAGPTDAGPVDAGPTDAGADAGPTDAGPTDAGPVDAGTDAGEDAGPIDAGPTDAGPIDGGPAMSVLYPLDDTDFTDDTSMSIEDLDEAASMTLTVSGLSMTLMANDGVLNQNSSGFGINHSGSGDEAAQIDGDAGDEVLTITFSATVSLTELDLSALSGSDEAAISINGGSPITATTSGLVDLGGATLTAGQTVTVAHVAGNGFRLDSIRVSVP